MLAEKELKKIVAELSHENCVKVLFDGIEVTINHVDGNPHKGSISACVYFGGNFIPQGVRNSLTKSINFKNPHLYTYLSIDEETFSVFLNYGGSWSLEEGALNHLLDEFCWIANEWRLYLDEQDRNDLVYVHVR